MKLDDIRRYSTRLDKQQDAVDGEKDSLKAIYEEVKRNGIRPDALRSARKLRRLKPADLRAWLTTFDACREALGLDAQMDIEDVKPEPRPAAGAPPSTEPVVPFAAPGGKPRRLN